MNMSITKEGVCMPFTLKLIVADALARSFLKCSVAHNGYEGCKRCQVVGRYIERRMGLDEVDAEPRTDEEFRNGDYLGIHQRKLSPLVEIVGCITQVPLDYMYLV